MNIGELKKAIEGLPEEMPVVLGYYYNGILLHMPFTDHCVAPDPNDGQEHFVLQENSL